MMMNLIGIIDKKRRGLAHEPAEIDFLVSRMMAGEVPDYQLAAWLMAVCCRGLDVDETAWLTRAFVESGNRLDLSGVGGVTVDKHSTGGVGDKTTLVLIPMLAACGVKLAKLSGRGLGFTGGTVDKLEAIPGLRVALSGADFLAQVRCIGMAISSQSPDLAPADGKIYALRDVTATVDSIPLIAASVMSKKIASGAEVIVLDVKYGQGAFMKRLEDAQALAAMCREIGLRLGRRVSTVISSMEQPLGFAIGHTVEVIETVQTLRNEGPADLETLCLTLGGVALQCAGIAPTREAGEQLLKRTLETGEALEKFRLLVETQGGDPAFLDDFSRLPQPKDKIVLRAEAPGTVSKLDALKIAQTAKALGAGRQEKSDPIDLSVGVVLARKIGDATVPGDTLATLWVRDQGIGEAEALVREAFEFSDEPVMLPLLVEAVKVPNQTPPAKV